MWQLIIRSVPFLCITVTPTFITCLGPAICPVGVISMYVNHEILREIYNLIIMAYDLMRRKGEIQL